MHFYLSFFIWDCICLTVLTISFVSASFASASFSGSESSNEVIVSITISGGTADRNISLPINLIEGTAKG